MACGDRLAADTNAAQWSMEELVQEDPDEATGGTRRQLGGGGGAPKDPWFGEFSAHGFSVPPHFLLVFLSVWLILGGQGRPQWPTLLTFPSSFLSFRLTFL